MIILAIETSCDDTCVAVVKVKGGKLPDFQILSNIVSSQVKIHAKYGGVYPFLAKREHQKNLPIIFEKAKKETKKPKFDLIAVTVGPGLEPCLWVGVNFAKELAKKLKVPIVPVNHIEAHIYANWLKPICVKFEIRNSKFETTNIFPAICLVVSGGHTQLILMRNFGKYKILGETRDDAAGECFDKAARILGLGYPGGPAIAQWAKKFKKTLRREFTMVNSLPRPMIYQKNYDFSFSGLKTAVLYLVKKNFYKNNQLTISNQQLAIISHEVQQAIIDVLIHKTLRAAKEHKVKTIILGGGVVANEELRKQFKSIVKCQMSNVKFFAPAKNLCTDNAAMVAVAGYFHREKGRKRKPEDIEAEANQRL